MSAANIPTLWKRRSLLCSLGAASLILSAAVAACTNPTPPRQYERPPSKQIEGLHRALVHPATRDEAFAILRQLIERVTVHPREDGVEIGLQGEIVAMVEVALGSDAAGTTDNKAALRRLMLDDGSRRSVKVVAGRGFEPLTFRL